MLIEISNLSFAYNGVPVLNDISMQVERGEKWSIIGCNGAGKSTLIKCIAGLESRFKGTIMIDGKPIQAMKPRDRARIIAYVPQAHGRALPFTAIDYVLMGRFAYQSFMALPSENDRRIALDALKITDTLDLANRTMTTLSGGEIQRVLLAGAVSQQAAIMLLDEPATFLDPLHQEMLQKALERIHDEFGTTILTVTHDVTSALNRFSNVLALVCGKRYYCGSSKSIRAESPHILARIFGIGFEAASAGDERTFWVPQIL